MPTLKNRKGLGRGLSALIPEAEMQALGRIARGDGLKPVVIPDLSTPDSSTTNKRDKTAERTALHLGQKPAIPKTTIPPQKKGRAPQEKVTAETSQITMPVPAEKHIGSTINWADIDQIQPNPYQPRRAFDPQEMEDLANSLREHGVLQPILVRPFPTHNIENKAHSADKLVAKNIAGSEPAAAVSYQIVAGERRWRAARMADLRQVPIIVREVADQQALELALIENVQRHDITAIDAAIAYRRLAKEFGLSQENVAARVGKSRAAVANTLRLLDLPPDVQKAIEESAITEGHGRAILLASGEGARRAIFRHVLREKLSVRDTEEAARKTLNGAFDSPEADTGGNGGAKNLKEQADLPNQQGSRRIKNESRRTAEVKRFEAQLQEQLKTRVRLQPRSKGGQIIIEYFSNDDLERLLPILSGKVH